MIKINVTYINRQRLNYEILLFVYHNRALKPPTDGWGLFFNFKCDLTII